MSAIAINQNSGEIVRSNPSLNGGVFSELKANEFGGRLRTARFTFTPSVAVAAGQVIGLVQLPKGARILDGKLISNGTVANSTATIGLAATDGSGVIDPSVPTADTANVFGSGFAINTAGSYTFGGTIAQNYGYETKVPVTVILTLVTAGMAGTGDSLQGHVTYITD